MRPGLLRRIGEAVGMSGGGGIMPENYSTKMWLIL